MEEIKEYIDWYRKERGDFCREFYIDKSSRFKKILPPYSDWNSQLLLDNESKLFQKSLDKLKSVSKESIKLSRLSLSNRVEYINDHSDFYVTYAMLLIFVLSIMAITTPALLALIVTSVIFTIVVYSYMKRVEFSREVAIYKEIINIFKHFESMQ